MAKTTLKKSQLSGVWSATPTPFTDKMNIDKVALRRLVKHHLRLGVKGLFVAGTCGEGPWMTDDKKRTLVQTVADVAQGDLVLAVQVTDNSEERIIENMDKAKKDGADIAVIAPPFMLMNATPERLLKLYTTAIKASPLPVGIYDRGDYSSVAIPDAVLKEVYAQRKVVIVKDSSSMPKRMKMAVNARKKRPGLRLFNGNEFDCVTYLKAGYDGLLLGGGCFNGYMAGKIFEAAKKGDYELANQLQERMTKMMHQVFGGKKNPCWLSGQKRLMVELGIFKTWKSYLEYPLTDNCVKAIQRVVKREKEFLLP